MMRYLGGQRQPSLLRYISVTPTTIPLVNNKHLSKRLKKDYNQLFKKFLEHGPLKLFQFPCNTPILSIVKLTREYGMV
jgi:hypothetical protein